MLVDLSNIALQQTLNYPDHTPNTLKSEYNRGHILMPSSDFVLNLFVEENMSVPERYWIRRLKIGTVTEFVNISHEDILAQSTALRDSTKFIGTSLGNRFLIAMNETTIGLFQHQCKERNLHAVERLTGNCIACSNLADYTVNQAICTSDPSAKFYLAEYKQIAIPTGLAPPHIDWHDFYQSVALLDVVGLVPANFDGFFEPALPSPKIFDGFNVYPDDGFPLFTLSYLGSSVDPITPTTLNLNIRVHLDPSNHLENGEKMAVDFNRVPNYSFENQDIHKQLTIVSKPENWGYAYWRTECDDLPMNELDYTWDQLNNQCFKCYKKEDFDQHPNVCGSYNIVRFFDWKLEFDFSKASQMNQRTYFAKISIPEYTDPQYSLFKVSYLMEKFEPNFVVDGQSAIISYDNNDVGPSDPQFGIKIELPENLQSTDELKFVQKSSDDGQLPISWIDVYLRTRLVYYDVAPQSLQLKRCNYFTEVLDYSTHQCMNCLEQAEFLLRPSLCRLGVTSRFFDWAVEKHPVQDEDTDGNIYIAVRVKEWSIGYVQYLPNTNLFLKSAEVSLVDPQYSVSFQVETVEMIGTFTGWVFPEPDPSPLPDLLYGIKIRPSKKLGTQSHENLTLQFRIPEGPLMHNIFQPSGSHPKTEPEKYGNLVRQTITP